jgi:hypothetical protein
MWVKPVPAGSYTSAPTRMTLGTMWTIPQARGRRLRRLVRWRTPTVPSWTKLSRMRRRLPPPHPALAMSGSRAPGNSPGIRIGVRRRGCIKRNRIFGTNADKHFQIRKPSKPPLHKRPSADEIERCRWWLDFELSQCGFPRRNPPSARRRSARRRHLFPPFPNSRRGLSHERREAVERSGRMLNDGHRGPP